MEKTRGTIHIYNPDGQIWSIRGTISLSTAKKYFRQEKKKSGLKLLGKFRYKLVTKIGIKEKTILMK